MPSLQNYVTEIDHEEFPQWDLRRRRRGTIKKDEGQAREVGKNQERKVLPE